MTDTRYNGWTNYPTWCVHLWLTNDANIYNAVMEHVNMAHGAGMDGAALLFTSRDGDESYARSVTAAALRAFTEEYLDDTRADMGSDLQAWAFAQTNWHEIVRAFLAN